MKTFTVIARIVPEGVHYLGTESAENGTNAALQARDRLHLTPQQFEVVAVAAGEIPWVPVTRDRIALAPLVPSVE
jgi:hypothetical protein